MENEQEQVIVPNEPSEPIKVELDDTSIKELEDSVTELVEAIKQEQEAKLEEKAIEEEQAKEQESLTQEEQDLLNAEKQSNMESEQDFRNQVLQSLNAEQPMQIDYTPYFETLISSLEEIKENQKEVSDAEHVINFYGLFVIPGIIIIFVLWKMIKPFLP